MNRNGELDRATIERILGRPLLRLRRVYDAKSTAFAAHLMDGKRLFLKITDDRTAASFEYRCLTQLGEMRRHLRHFVTPRPMDLIVASRWSCLVLEHAPGLTLKALQRRGYDVQNLIVRAAVATAELHFALHEIAATEHVRTDPLESWQQWRSHDDRMLLDEASPVSKRFTEFSDAMKLLIERARTRWDGRLDVYKDANPANWIVSNDRLVAVDFESARLRPWMVDLINLSEYAPEPGDLDRTAGLIHQYALCRGRLETGFKHRYDAALVHLFGVIRHQEQVLHRSRDILRGGPHTGMHMDGLLRHIIALTRHAALLTKEPRAVIHAASTLRGISMQLLQSLSALQ